MADISYFRKINNAYKSQSRQDTDLYLLNKDLDRHFADSIDYHKVEKNGEPFELIIIKDTDANTDKKKIKARPGQYFNLGDIILWKGQHWIVFRTDTDDKALNSGYMYLCNYCLRWMNNKRQLVERWVYIQDYTKYSSGFYDNGTIKIADNQYGVIMPYDNETIKLKRGQRFAIDGPDADIPDTYELTNRKPVIDNNLTFGRGAIITAVLSFSEFNATSDKKMVNEFGEEVWVCDVERLGFSKQTVTEITNQLTEDINIVASITGNQYLKLGYPKTYTGYVIPDTPVVWKVDADFDIAAIEVSPKDKEVVLKFNDEALLGKTIELCMTDGFETVLASHQITLITV